MMSLGICIIGAGKIALANHLPGIALSARASVTALCDGSGDALAAARRATGVTEGYLDFRQAIASDSVDAVIVATPNHTHTEIVEACAAAGKHVLCEKPLALNVSDATAMWRACEAANIRHMTAFTYRFVPAMRWMHHLVARGDIGQPVHFRAVRFQDWGERPLGWRQVQTLAGTGELADMLSHRIDYGHLLIGRIKRLSASMKTIVPMRGGKPSDVDDWVAMLADFDSDVTGVLESTKLATGRGEGYGGRDDVEINGTEGSIVYSTQSPLELKIAKRGESELRTVPVPAEFLVWPGSPRDPRQGDPRVTFRYDQSVEFINAILEQRSCRPTLREGADCQAVMDACVVSSNERRWVDVMYPFPDPPGEGGGGGAAVAGEGVTPAGPHP